MHAAGVVHVVRMCFLLRNTECIFAELYLASDSAVSRRGWHRRSSAVVSAGFVNELMIFGDVFLCLICRWLGSLVVRALDSRLDGSEFDSWLLRLILRWVGLIVFGRTNHLIISPSHQANSAFYPHLENKPRCGDAEWLGSKVRMLIPLVNKRVGGRLTRAP